MASYVKKPIPVQAVQYRKGLEHPAIKIITGYAGVNMLGQDVFEDAAVIETYEGNLNVVEGAWIVGPGHKGEYWPVDDEIFRATYEEIRE